MATTDTDATVAGTPMPEFNAAVADLFQLNAQWIPAAQSAAMPDSADCTNDGCTNSCNSCGCR